MIVFLSIVGVLYPSNSQSLLDLLAYCRIPRFENVIRDFNDVDIVICADWHQQSNLTQLQALFSPDIASRFIGSTSMTRDIGKYQFARREGEILDWLKKHGRELEHWIAVDDAIWQYSPPRNRLIVCQNEVGFDAKIAKRLRQELELNTVIEFDPLQIQLSKKGLRRKKFQSLGTLLMRDRIKDWLPF